MNNSCDVNDAQKKKILADPSEAIDIVGGKDIRVTKNKVGEKMIYIVSYNQYAPPTITINSAVRAVGTQVSGFEFRGEIIPGSTAILNRAMTPDLGLDLSTPFNWIEPDFTGTSPGLWPRFNGTPRSITALDSDGTTVSKSVGVEFRNWFYMGYSEKETLTESEIKALVNKDLLTGILSKYSSYTYTPPIAVGAATVFIYWVFPLSSTGFTVAIEDPQPVPLFMNHASVNLTFPGLADPVPYRIIRTALKTYVNNTKILLKP